jgi:hypothetical protein
MYGPGTPAPPPRANRAVVLGLRVLFAVLPLATLGVGAWGSVLRLAVMRRRRIDWVLLPIVAVLGIGGFILIGESLDNSPQSQVGAVGIFICMLAVPVYFLVADILWTSSGGRRAQQPAASFPHAAPHPPAAGAPHGAGRGPIPGPGPIAGPPGMPPGMTTPPRTAGGPGMSGVDGVSGQPPYAYGPPPQAQPPAVLAPQAAPPRISQVRAELDELSDYLRKEEGR